MSFRVAKMPGSVEPLHFDKREDLEAWLKEKPREVAIAIAARAALRVLPLAALEIPRPGDDAARQHFFGFVATVFRATALVRAAGVAPTKIEWLRVVRRAEASLEAFTLLSVSTFGSSVQFLADAASGLLHTLGSDFVSFAASVVRDAVHAAGAAADDAWRAISADAALIARGGLARDKLSSRARELVHGALLWFDGTPKWAADYWSFLRDALPPEDDWQVWIDWYHRRLEGSPDPEDFEFIYVDVPIPEWDKGPAAANKWIKERLEEIKSAEITEAAQFGDTASAEVRHLTPSQLPQPLASVPSPFAFGWNSAAKLTIVAGPHNVPVFPFSASEKDHAQYLEACRTQVERLLADWNGRRMNVRSEYGEALERYRDDLPLGPGAGNIMLADAEARILRDMFEADADFLPAFFAARLKILLQQHIALRNFYPEVERFYVAVRSGRLVQPLPQDAVRAFERTVRDNTPDVFDTEVSWGLQEVARQPPLIEFAPEDIRQRTPVPFPPHDPLGELEPQKSRSFERASSINSLYEAFLKGKDIPEAVAVWSNLAQKLGENAGPVIEWLKNFVLPT